MERTLVGDVFCPGEKDPLHVVAAKNRSGCGGLRLNVGILGSAPLICPATSVSITSSVFTVHIAMCGGDQLAPLTSHPLIALLFTCRLRESFTHTSNPLPAPNPAESTAAYLKWVVGDSEAWLVGA
jgi:hypothetical protein